MNLEKLTAFLETFIPSPEMRAYLSDPALWDPVSVTETVLCAPAPLETKAAWLTGEDKRRVDDAIREMKTLRDGDIFTLSAAWFDEEIFNEKQAFEGPVSSFEKAIEMIRLEREEEEADEDSCEWYVLEKWRLEASGNYARAYTFTLFGDEAVFFKKEGDRPSRTVDLNLPVPFEVGDLPTVDCRPFAPPVPALLLEKGDNRDCCCLQILYRDLYTRKWKVCALKHGLVLNAVEGSYTPPLSPLYRLSRLDLPKDDGALRQTGKALAGNDSKGRALWKLLHGYAVEEADPELQEIAAKLLSEMK